MEFFYKWLVFLAFVFAAGIGGYIGTRIGLYFHLRKCMRDENLNKHFSMLLKSMDMAEFWRFLDNDIYK